MKKLGQSLTRIVEGTDHLKQIHKSDLQFGDMLCIRTCNSDYLIRVLDNGFYLVSGGWFDHHGLSPMRLKITGCTWGGSIIKLDIAAACGLCLEFSNRVITSPINKVNLIRNGGQN
ncbi:hypothetical protein MJD09_20280 [bacterium]|nr:hypothetical protein [bacterium]